MTYLLIIIGLGLLVAGGELLTSSSSRLALVLGIRPILIGLTVVAFGTSMPEAFVSLYAALEKKPDIAMANVVGSNIFNIAFILGLAAIIRPLKVQTSSFRREMPFVVFSTILLWIFSLDRMISRPEGVGFVLLLFVFIVVCFCTIKPETTFFYRKSGNGKKLTQILFILLALVLLTAGARFLVTGGSQLARGMGVSELIIGLTIIAVGTSLPELATSILAAVRKRDDIAVGNVTGSNIFNILFILGFAAIVHPLQISDTLFYRDMPLMIGLSLLTIPIMKTGSTVSRVEGIGLVAGYLGYVGWFIGRS